MERGKLAKSQTQKGSYQQWEFFVVIYICFYESARIACLNSTTHNLTAIVPIHTTPPTGGANTIVVRCFVVATIH